MLQTHTASYTRFNMKRGLTPISVQGDDRIVVADPIDFIRYWQGDDHENRV